VANGPNIFQMLLVSIAKLVISHLLYYFAYYCGLCDLVCLWLFRMHRTVKLHTKLKLPTCKEKYNTKWHREAATKPASFSYPPHPFKERERGREEGTRSQEMGREDGWMGERE